MVEIVKPAVPEIVVENVNFRRDGKDILSDVSLTIYNGDFVAVTGPNGGGKTTLLRIMLKLLKPTSGTVMYYGRGNQAVDALNIGYLPQKNMIDSRFPIAVEEVIRSGMIGRNRIPVTERDERLEEMLRTVDLVGQRRQSIGSLSGGQLQRALLGRALICSPTVLFLDEPLSYIDKRFEKHLYEIIEQLAPKMTIILVSHEMSVIAGMANRHIIVDHTVRECTCHHHFIPSECP